MIPFLFKAFVGYISLRSSIIAVSTSNLNCGRDTKALAANTSKLVKAKSVIPVPLSRNNSWN